MIPDLKEESKFLIIFFENFNFPKKSLISAEVVKVLSTYYETSE